MDIDYDKDDGGEQQLFQVTYSGPYLFAAYTW